MSYDFNFVNNVLFNWRHRTMDGGDQFSLINCINNYYRPGPKTPEAPIRYCIVRPDPTSAKGAEPKFGKAYVAGNIVEGNERVTADNWAGGVQIRIGGSEEDAKIGNDEAVKAVLEKVRSDKPFPMAPVTTQTAQEAYLSVLSGAGATLPHRDPVDLRILEEVRTGKVTYEAGQGIITDPKQVGGYPQYGGKPFADLDADGIPVSWKKHYSLDIKDSELANRDLKGDGYTVLEKYLDGLNPTKKIDWSDPKSNVNRLGANSHQVAGR